MQTISKHFTRPLEQILTEISVMLNEHPMYEYMLSDEIFPGVLGMLECQSRSNLEAKPSLIFAY
jgi:hypothetical protein